MLASDKQFKNQGMKAICIHQSNDFDHEVGSTRDLEDIYFTWIWRNGEDVKIENEERPGYLKPENVLLSLLKENDIIEDNYCHGRYLVV